jgi:dimethylargininase
MAITKAVGNGLERCELTYLERQPIDPALAARQHRAYEACLAELGARVISLPAEPGLPDGIFVEDPALVLDETAILARMGAESRRGESRSVAQALARFRPLLWMSGPGTLEGGDVMRVGKTLYVGVSARTNAAGITELCELVKPLGYSTVPVEARGCLHLKSGCCYLGNGVVLANREWIGANALDGCRVVDVAPDEPWAANVLVIGGTAIMPAGFPHTAEIIERLGWKVRAVDISELMKAEAGVTCSSLIFEARA